MPYERAGRASCGGAQRVLNQPLVKLGSAAVEPAELVSLAQLLGEDPQARYRDTTRRARSPALARTGLGCGFSSSAEISWSKKAAGTSVTASRSRKTSSARCSAAVRTKSLADSSTSLAACSIRSLDSCRSRNSSRFEARVAITVQLYGTLGAESRGVARPTSPPVPTRRRGRSRPAGPRRERTQRYRLVPPAKHRGSAGLARLRGRYSCIRRFPRLRWERQIARTRVGTSATSRLVNLCAAGATRACRPPRSTDPPPS